MQVETERLAMTSVRGEELKCTFFNYSAQGANQTTGGWSYRGVITDVINTTHVRCIASHLTSFAVLVSIVPSVGEPVSGDVLLIFDVLLNCILIPAFIYMHPVQSPYYLPLSLQPALDYITYIGCSISLLCLLACIIFYLTLR